MTEALRFTIPGLKLISGLNVREHWAKRAKRVRSERDQTRLASIASARSGENAANLDRTPVSGFLLP